MVEDWVDPDWSKGRICKDCETKYAPAAVRGDAELTRRESETSERNKH